jgi:hypothetical protein
MGSAALLRRQRTMSRSIGTIPTEQISAKP